MKHFLLLILLGTSFFSFSQRIEVTAGPILDEKKVHKEMDIPLLYGVKPYYIQAYPNTIVFNPQKKLTYAGYSIRNNAFLFAALEDHINYSGIKRLSAELIDDKVNLNEFLIINNKMYVIYSQKFPELDEFSVYVNEVSDDMVVLGTPLIVQNYKKLNQYGMNILVSSSEDEKHILISRLYDNRSREKKMIHCKMVNQSFSESWSKLIETKSLDENIKIESIDVDNAGNVFMLFELKEGKTKQPQLYSYFWKEQALKVATLGLPTGKNYSTKLKILNGERPYMIGLNEHKKELSCFINRLNIETQQLENFESVPVPKDVYKVSQFGIIKKEHWRVSEIVTLSDNSIVASMEAILATYPIGLYRSVNAYVVSFNEAGTHKWSRTIRKKQATLLRGSAGHSLVPADTDVLVIYNDAEGNLTLSPDDKRVSIYRGTTNTKPVVQEIDGNGKVSKYAFTTDKDLAGMALNFIGFKKIEKSLYFSSGLHMKSNSNIKSRHLTFKVK